MDSGLTRCLAEFSAERVATAAEAHAAFKAAETLKARLFDRWLELADQERAAEHEARIARWREAGL